MHAQSGECKQKSKEISGNLLDCAVIPKRRKWLAIRPLWSGL